MGPNLIMARDGLEASQRLHGGSSNVDLVILDLHMPDRDGIEVIKDVAEMANPPDIILISASDRTLRAAHALATAFGVNILGALEKPVKLEDLNLLLIKAEQPAKASFEKGELSMRSSRSTLRLSA
jgi:CheY-like chemotaxis protein